MVHDFEGQRAAILSKQAWSLMVYHKECHSLRESAGCPERKTIAQSCPFGITCVLRFPRFIQLAFNIFEDR